MEFDEGKLRSKLPSAGDDGNIGQRQDHDGHDGNEEHKSRDCELGERDLDRRGSGRESATEESMLSRSEHRSDNQKDRDDDVSFADQTVATDVPPTAGPLLPDQFPPLGSVPRPSLLVTTELENATSECVVLKNVFDGAVEKSPEFYLEIKESIHESCAQFGPVFHIHVDENLGFVYLRFNSKWASKRAQKALLNSMFEGRVIAASFMSSRLYDTMFSDYWAELFG